MALGTPIAGTVAYSTFGGTSVSPIYPSGILATDVVLLITGQKPNSADGGTVTTPAGWTLREEITGAGGYGTTLGTDAGNTNLRIYSWDAPVAGQTGTRSVTLSDNNISWAFIVRIPTGGGAPEFGFADGSRTTAPTAGTPFTVALTNGASATNFQAGDLAIWAMCIPTDVTTPNQFSDQSVTATGATFATAVELNEPDTAVGSDIGGYSAYALVSSGSSTTAPSATVTASGTVTNVRGPVAMLRVREGAAPQTLTPSRYDNTNTFYSPTVTQGTASQNLSPARYNNTNVFYSAAVTKAVYPLLPARYNNTNVFYSATVAAFKTLTPARYDNVNTFFTPTITQFGSAQILTPARYNNVNTFFTPTVTQYGGAQILTPARYNNVNTLFSPTVSTVLPPDENFVMNVRIRSFTERRRF